MMYRLARVGDDERGWGRLGDTQTVSRDLAAHGMGTPWFTVGDLDIATHLARTLLLAEGRTLTQVTAILCARWRIPVAILPVTDDRIVSFQEWWVRMRAQVPARAFERAAAAPPELSPAARAAISAADVVLIAPSNPVVSIGRILQVRGVADAVRDVDGPIVGVSPLIDGAAVRGMATECLRAIGVDVTAAAVARHYGARRYGGLLDQWLVDTADAVAIPGLHDAGIPTRAVPLLMRDAAAARRLAGHALTAVGVTGIV